MSTTTTDGPAHARLGRPVSTMIARTEIERVVALLTDLDDTDWSRPTDCSDWDVRAVAGHVLGMLQTFSALRRFVPDMGAATAAAGDDLLFIDALTARQVQRNAVLDERALVEQIRTLGPVQASWRARRRLMRNIPVKNEMPDGTTETWRLGYLVDVILNRDPWMHRVDLARAVGRPMVLTADHDGRIVADVVDEWAERHGHPYDLTLTGPAGGHWSQGEGATPIELDAVEFCRILSGRAAGEGLLATFVPF